MTQAKAAPRGKMYGLIPHVAKCATCKQKFERPTGDWGYKTKGKYFCTYKCMRIFERGKGM